MPRLFARTSLSPGRAAAARRARSPCAHARSCLTLTAHHSPHPLSLPTSINSLLAGKSGVGSIDRFDASEFPTTFAAQIRNFDNEG